MSKKLLSTLLLLAVGFVLPIAGASADAAGANAYKRCSACHLATGAGVPGSFPAVNDRLAGLSNTKAGREYLIMVVSSGLMGPIEVDGATYRGMMPAQGSALKNAGIANVLNYVVQELSTAPDGFNQFTEEEVAEVKALYPKANGRTAHGLRQGAFASVE